jgi:hypothetical protein
MKNDPEEITEYLLSAARDCITDREPTDELDLKPNQTGWADRYRLMDLLVQTGLSKPEAEAVANRLIDVISFAVSVFEP